MKPITPQLHAFLETLRTAFKRALDEEWCKKPPDSESMNRARLLVRLAQTLHLADLKLSSKDAPCETIQDILENVAENLKPIYFHMRNFNKSHLQALIIYINTHVALKGGKRSSDLPKAEYTIKSSTFSHSFRVFSRTMAFDTLSFHTLLTSMKEQASALAEDLVFSEYGSSSADSIFPLAATPSHQSPPASVELTRSLAVTPENQIEKKLREARDLVGRQIDVTSEGTLEQYEKRCNYLAHLYQALLHYNQAVNHGDQEQEEEKKINVLLSSALYYAILAVGFNPTRASFKQWESVKRFLTDEESLFESFSRDEYRVLTESIRAGFNLLTSALQADKDVGSALKEQLRLDSIQPIPPSSSSDFHRRYVQPLSSDFLVDEPFSSSTRAQPAP